MSEDTPRTDGVIKYNVPSKIPTVCINKAVHFKEAFDTMSRFSKELERENNELREENRELKEKH